MLYIGNQPADTILTTDQIADGAVTATDLANGAIEAKLGFTPQPALVSGTSIKTINGTSVLGSGDIVVSSSGGGGGGGFEQHFLLMGA